MSGRMWRRLVGWELKLLIGVYVLTINIMYVLLSTLNQ